MPGSAHTVFNMETCCCLLWPSPKVNFHPYGLFFHEYSESWEASALGHTPEPCYATAPNNSHLLLLLCQFNTSQDVPCVYTWIIYSDSLH